MLRDSLKNYFVGLTYNHSAYAQYSAKNRVRNWSSKWYEYAENDQKKKEDILQVPLTPDQVQ